MELYLKNLSGQAFCLPDLKIVGLTPGLAAYQFVTGTPNFSVIETTVLPAESPNSVPGQPVYYGMQICCPTIRLSGVIDGLAASRASSDTLNLRAMLKKVSPALTT